MRVTGGMYDASLLPEASPLVRRHDEDLLQKSVFEYLAWALPDEGIAYAIPNGGKRHAREAARMKGLGVRAGMPDIGICYRGKALYVELKSARGVVSEAQRNMIRKLTYCGASVMVVRSVSELEAGLREACVPLRASAMA